MLLLFFVVEDVELNVVLWHPVRRSASYMIFSHTIKAQPYNMPFLDACLARNVRLFDYECIRAPENEGGQRLVAFGKYAGLCGMVDGFRGLGARLLALGYSTPFMGMAQCFMYVVKVLLFSLRGGCV